MATDSPAARFWGPRWCRVGWSERVNGFGQVVGIVVTLFSCPRGRLTLEVNRGD